MELNRSENMNSRFIVYLMKSVDNDVVMSVIYYETKEECSHACIFDRTQTTDIERCIRRKLMHCSQS